MLCPPHTYTHTHTHATMAELDQDDRNIHSLILCANVCSGVLKPVMS